MNQETPGIPPTETQIAQRDALNAKQKAIREAELEIIHIVRALSTSKNVHESLSTQCNILISSLDAATAREIP